MINIIGKSGLRSFLTAFFATLVLGGFLYGIALVDSTAKEGGFGEMEAVLLVGREDTLWDTEDGWEKLQAASGFISKCDLLLMPRWVRLSASSYKLLDLLAQKGAQMQRERDFIEHAGLA